MAEKSILDARLAEIDRRLRTIQSGLEPAAQAAPGSSAGARFGGSRHRALRWSPPEAAPVPKRLTPETRPRSPAWWPSSWRWWRPTSACCPSPAS